MYLKVATFFQNSFYKLLLEGLHLLGSCYGSVNWGHLLGTVFNLRVTCPFLEKLSVWGDNICLRNMLPRLSLFECVDHEAGTN